MWGPLSMRLLGISVHSPVVVVHRAPSGGPPYQELQCNNRAAIWNNDNKKKIYSIPKAAANFNFLITLAAPVDSASAVKRFLPLSINILIWLARVFVLKGEKKSGMWEFEYKFSFLSIYGNIRLVTISWYRHGETESNILLGPCLTARLQGSFLSSGCYTLQFILSQNSFMTWSDPDNLECDRH